MNTISATQARDDLYNLIEEVSLGKRVAITNKGETKAVLVSPEELRSWEVTMEVMNDPELMESLRESEKDIKAGRVRDWEDIKKELGIDVQSKIHKSRRKRSKKVR